MAPKLDSPVQTQMAIGALKNLLTAERHGSPRIGRQQSAGRRRVFVQTESGCVLGLELDRIDNAHTVKRKLQLALHVSTEESSLTFGDRVLENDLSAIPMDSPLLLTRNQMHRSSSTPCLSPSGRDIQQRDRSSPIEVLGHSHSFDNTKQMVREIVKGIKHGIDPMPIKSGLGGAYYFRSVSGECVAIVKPTDEEPFAPNNPKGFVGKALGQPGLKPSVRVGETGIREVAAYLLDEGHLANVPATSLVKITHSIFNINDTMNGNNKTHKKQLVSKIASLQQFVPHDFDASDHGTSSFPVSAVHRIGMLDIRIFNTDRHAGNLLVRKLDAIGGFGQVELIPIDHGLCLPECLEDPYFEWIHWPQASLPFSEDELDYIKNLEPDKDCEMLRKELPMIREACLRVLTVCTIFLKEAASYGLCLAEIGEMMTREFRTGDEEPSELEVVCLEAKRLVAAERELNSPKSLTGEEDYQFHIDCEDLDWNYDFIRSPSFRMGSVNGRNPLSRLGESIKEEEEDNETVAEAEAKDLSASNLSTPLRSLSRLGGSIKVEKEDNETVAETEAEVEAKELQASQKLISASTLPTSLKSLSLAGKPQNGYKSSGQRSANEQLPASASFVKFTDMGEDNWALFLDKFKEQLPLAFANRKTVITGQMQRQRLGTSCQF